MKNSPQYLVILGLICCTYAKISEDELKQYLNNVYEREASDQCRKAALAQFDFETDIRNKKKEELTTNLTLEQAAWEKNVWTKYFKDIVPEEYEDPTIRREVKFLKILGSAALEPKKLEELNEVNNRMTEIYSTGKICPYKIPNCDLAKEGLTLEPGIENIMSSSKDYDELLYAWSKWRDATGAKMKDLYKKYVQLSNDEAKANNFSDKGEYWRFAYEDPHFVENIDTIWKEVEPLYNELHKYVGNKLKDRYGPKLDMKDGLLPAHVFGNMWAQSWEHLRDILEPFPNAGQMNVDAEMKKQGYTLLEMFKKADEFYQSLGLYSMEMCYNESAGAMIRKPTDGREVLCHASAWDFCDKKTFRLKMCTDVTFEDFRTIHHEMGHIQYYLQYKHLSHTFREGANPAFHEAVGDTMALSVSTPTHLKKIKLLNNFDESYESDINTLMNMALEKISFLPFGLLIDKWRWDVFSGAVQADKWNSHWWHYRMKYQKVKPPIERSDTRDFDPGAKYHIPGDSQYIAYFVAHILQFQFYKSLCIEAKQYDPHNRAVPLHRCDFYNSVAAGDKLKAGLSLGASKHWSETLEIMTGSKVVSAQPLLEYFEPLYKFLKAENEKKTEIHTDQKM
ncbi:unnamed protein product [Acanthoscelides obtectus]|uniref:Angiotensin-converting enzyme n=1 Tax=Acanthoscelides obtectus TaxID=200917 RepID=A0A9P0LGL5_ACAOB|nr:unnamed protein product [Acanthoscelides obtectus]CAK1631720.1 Angiotensin-converting enzyme [Acanthoscelides obtectus]